MRNKTYSVLSSFLMIFSLTFLISSCATTPNNKVEINANRYAECEVLADKATVLHLNALNSGETNYSSPEWKIYDDARDRYNILNCKEWWPLPYS